MTINIEAEVARLEQMPVRELREEYAERCGEMTSSQHRKYLIRKIAWRIQAQAEGRRVKKQNRRQSSLTIRCIHRAAPQFQTRVDRELHGRFSKWAMFHGRRVPSSQKIHVRLVTSLVRQRVDGRT